MAPIVSILMGVYNRADFMPTAIESALAQEMGDFELIISDNVSTDATAEIAQRYARQDRRIRFFRNITHVSAAENFNLCYQRSDPASTYISLLPSDDWWAPELLAQLSTAGERYPAAALIHSDSYRTDVTGQVINRYSDLMANFLPPAGPHRAVRELFRGCYVSGLTALIKREKLEQIDPAGSLFDLSLKWVPDYNLWLQLLTRGALAYYLPKPLGYHRKHPGEMSAPTNAVLFLRDEITLFRDKLQGVCPPELEDARREALLNRIAALGFELLRSGQADEARSRLHEARQLDTHRRLDLTVARAIAALPLTTGLRGALWQRAVATSQALRRAP